MTDAIDHGIFGPPAALEVGVELEAAQARGELATRQNNPGSQGHMPAGNMPPATLADLGITARERGELATPGGARNFKIPAGNNETPTLADLGITGKQAMDEPRDLFGLEQDPARFACPAARRRAFDAWVASGRPWPPTPAGMLSAIAGAALGQGRRR